MRIGRGLAAVAVAAAAVPALAGALDAYRWENRLLIAFAPSDAVMAAQTAEIAIDPTGFEDHDLVLIRVVDDHAASDRGDRFDAAALRRRFGVARAEQVALLVGKDGGEKLRVADRPMTLNTLFAAIDVMPMRRREMLERRN
ncbi:MAG: DUF4174 domain-containing protein [Pseudomonadota bacterium]